MVALKLFLLWLMLATSLAATNQRRRLVQTLVDNYNKMSPPQLGVGVALNVSHHLALKRIVSLDNQVLTIDTIETMAWYDDRLVWDTEDFGGINHTQIPANVLWKPDITLYNDADPMSNKHVNDYNVIVSYSGHIVYARPSKTKSYCSTDHTRIKRNSQVTCSLTFISWTNDCESLNLTFTDEKNIHIPVPWIHEFDENFNKDWRLVNSDVTRNKMLHMCSPYAPNGDLVYDFTLEKL